MSPEIRVVSFEELEPRTAYDLWRLRQDVFVVEQTSIYHDLDGRDLEVTTSHVLLEDEGALIGCVRVLDDGGWMRIGRVAIVAPARGGGLGARLMDEAMTICGTREIRLDAQTGLADFYADYGFEVDGPAFDDGGILHVPMRRPCVS